MHLVPFCAQYQAMAHPGWLALHAHRRVDVAQTSLMWYHSDEACKILVVVKVEAKKTPRKSLPKRISVIMIKKSALLPPASRRRSTKRAAVRDPVTSKPKFRKGEIWSLPDIWMIF